MAREHAGTVGVDSNIRQARVAAVTRVELHRELGQFDEARQALTLDSQGDYPGLCRISAQLIDENHAAPVRYAA